LSPRLPRIPVRPAAFLGAAGLAFGSALLAVPAHAAPLDGGTGVTGKATAVAAKVDLHVSVLNSITVPVTASLNSVSAPGDADRTLLTAHVKGVHDGRSVQLVKAEVAHSSAKANTSRATGAVKLVGVRAYVPGLPLKPLLKADLLKADASCVQGQKPTASAELENVEVLGKAVDVEKLQGSAGQKIKVPGLGSVDLAVEQVTKTDVTGAATALQLTYTVNPAHLGVVKTSGEITLAKATCATPSGSGEGSNSGTTEASESSSSNATGSTAGSQGAGSGASTSGGTTPQSGGHGSDLAETGASSATTLIGGLGVATLLAGGGTLFLMRRRNAGQRN
jgi:LPXTG-motif cell wall-anchored protein